MLRLEFTAFTLENNDHESCERCSCDNLKVRDGDGTTLMEKRCGTFLPPAITSRSNVVHLDFNTDGGTVRSGWSIDWFAKPTGEQKLNFIANVCIFIKYRIAKPP